MTAEQWLDAVTRIVVAEHDGLRPLAPKHVGPCYATVEALGPSYRFANPDDPVVEAAWWEYVAWAALKLGLPHGLDVARHARALADHAVLEYVA